MLDLRMQSYEVWKIMNGSVALHPSQMFPENYTPSDKLKFYHFTCNNYWSGGVPEIWKAKNPSHYSRAGYDVFGGLSGNKLPYVIENGWGNPAPQDTIHFNTFIKSFLENDILKRNRNHK